MVYIFVDTNIFLHFKFFMEVPWGKLFGDPYKIVLAPIVVDELDKHKRNSNSKIASRARQVLSRFEQIVQKSETFPLLYLDKRPKSETFQKFQLDRQEQDDLILAAIVEFKEKIKNENVIFVSNDTGPRFRAASLGIKSIRLSDEFQNPVEVTAEQKLIKALTLENTELKNSKPILSLSFNDGSNLLKYQLSPIFESEVDFISRLNKKMLDEYPLIEYKDPLNNKQEIEEKPDTNSIAGISYLISQQNSWSFNDLTKEQCDGYNFSLNEFYEMHIQYLQELYKYKRAVSLRLPIDLTMHNNGSAPGIDIDVWLHFPDGFILVDSSKFPKPPQAPKAPYKPKNRFDFIGGFGIPRFPSIGNLGYPSPSMPEYNFNKPEIGKTNSYEVDIPNFKNLKHFQNVSIDQLLVIYPSSNEIISFDIDYRIIASNIPEPVKGKLSVVAEIT